MLSIEYQQAKGCQDGGVWKNFILPLLGLLMVTPTYMGKLAPGPNYWPELFADSRKSVFIFCH
jgi:hypothetical protein